MTDTPPVHGFASSTVGVALSDCTPRDADAVLRVLCTDFPSDRKSGERPEDGATVWLTTLDAASLPEPCPAEPLSGPVTADIQGNHEALDRVRAALMKAYTLSEATAASGDQEEELHLRLMTHH
ncbi:hypothetical protein [Streptomyces sp. WG-D5]